MRVLAILLITVGWAAARPARLFSSDLESGPNTGGESNGRVSVTVWGRNFGASPGPASLRNNTNPDPRFVTAASNDLGLQAANPAIDAGLNTEVPTDTGAPVASVPPEASAPVRLLISGRPVQLLFRGLIPRAAVVMQLNALIPDGLAPSDAIPGVRRAEAAFASGLGPVAPSGFRPNVC